MKPQFVACDIGRQLAATFEWHWSFIEPQSDKFFEILYTSFLKIVWCSMKVHFALMDLLHVHPVTFLISKDNIWFALTAFIQLFFSQLVPFIIYFFLVSLGDCIQKCFFIIRINSALACLLFSLVIISFFTFLYDFLILKQSYFSTRSLVDQWCLLLVIKQT